jgi:transposase-like protein
MRKTRRKHSADFKVKVVLDMLKEAETLSELGSKHGVHPTQITKWKSHFVERAAELFSENSGPSKIEKEKEHVEEALYQKIGQLQMELDWLKKKSGLCL